MVNAKRLGATMICQYVRDADEREFIGYIDEPKSMFAWFKKARSSATGATYIFGKQGCKR